MKSAALTLGTVAILCVVAVIAYRLLRPRNDEPGGFRDWVKNPDYKDAIADYFAAREALKVPDNISNDEIQKMVDRLFVSEDEDFNFDRLQLVGSKAVPMLIKALEDPRTTSTKFDDRVHAFGAKSPFERIVNLLEPIASDDTVQALARYIDHEDDHFRKHAAMAIGNIGNSECITPMLKALNDDNDYVRSWAMMGIQSGIKAKRCRREFLDEMFPVLTKLLNRDDDSSNDSAPKLLLEIDPDQALKVLLSAEYFSSENRKVHYIIRALTAARQKIRHDTLLPFLESVKPVANQYPYYYHYAEALKAYACNPDASAEQLFRLELTSSNKRVREAASEALAILSGVTDARKIVFEAIESQGFEQLSLPQQHYYAVFIYDAEVNNGGHSQYFVNSSGQHWKSALEGLKAIGAAARAEILHKATLLFGAAGPSVHNDSRHRQLASFSTEQQTSLDELNSQYYACDENISALLDQYTIQNKEHFSARK